MADPLKNIYFPYNGLVMYVVHDGIQFCPATIAFFFFFLVSTCRAKVHATLQPTCHM